MSVFNKTIKEVFISKDKEIIAFETEEDGLNSYSSQLPISRLEGIDNIIGMKITDVKKESEYYEANIDGIECEYGVEKTTFFTTKKEKFTINSVLINYNLEGDEMLYPIRQDFREI